MIEYHAKVDDVIRCHIHAPPMQRLRMFEQKCQGLFDDPLDLSPQAAIAYFGPEDGSLPVPPEIASASRSGDDQLVSGPSPLASPLTVNESTMPHHNSDPPTIDEPIDSTSNPQSPNFITPVQDPDLDKEAASTPSPEALSQHGSGQTEVMAPEAAGLRSIFLLFIVSVLVGLLSVYILRRPT